MPDAVRVSPSAQERCSIPERSAAAEFRLTVIQRPPCLRLRGGGRIRAALEEAERCSNMDPKENASFSCSHQYLGAHKTPHVHAQICGIKHILNILQHRRCSVFPPDHWLLPLTVVRQACLHIDPLFSRYGSFGRGLRRSVILMCCRCGAAAAKQRSGSFLPSVPQRSAASAR